MENQKVLELARSQHGIVSREQLIRSGMANGTINERISSGHLIRICRGVYGLGHDVVGQRGKWLAATLAGGPSTFLFGRTAAALWGIVSPSGRVEVVRKRSRYNESDPTIFAPFGRRTKLTIHRSRCLPESDLTVYQGIPTTTVARTLLDLAAFLSQKQLEYALAAAGRAGLIRVSEIKKMLERGRGWKGIGKLRKAFNEWNPEAEETKSNLEIDFLGLCRDHDLPMPAVNVLVEGHLVDCFWTEAKLVLEVDSYKYHSDQVSFDGDRDRDFDLTAVGYQVVRVSDRHLSRNPEAVAKRLRRILNRSGVSLPGKFRQSTQQ